VGHATLPQKLGAVFIPGTFAALVYWLTTLWTKVPAAREITALIFQRFRGRPD
jgi:hypothetical protein